MNEEVFFLDYFKYIVFPLKKGIIPDWPHKVLVRNWAYWEACTPHPERFPLGGH